VSQVRFLQVIPLQGGNIVSKKEKILDFNFIFSGQSSWGWNFLYKIFPGVSLPSQNELG
jgi:hypothetical protein